MDKHGPRTPGINALSNSQDSTENLEYPELPPELVQPRFSTLVKYFGPGAIIASITIGSGETLFASRSGAIFEFSLLWLYLLATLGKGLQVYSGARHITLTGQHPLASWNHVPWLRGWFPILIAVLSISCFPFWLGGLPKMLGTLTNWIAYVPAGDPGSIERAHYDLMVKVWGTGFLLVAVGLTLLQSYKFLERVQSIIVGLLLASLLAAAIASSPNLLEVLLGSIIPSIPEYPDWLLEKIRLDPEYTKAFSKRPVLQELAVYVGAMGGGTQDYLGYVGILREKAWGLTGRFKHSPQYDIDRPLPLPLDREQVARGKGWLRAPRIDIVISFSCVVIFTYAFIILGAQILNPKEIAPVKDDELLTVQKDFLATIHASLTYLYQVGVFMAFFGTIHGAFEIYVRTTHECLMVVIPPLRNLSVNKARPWVLAYCGIGALLLMWTNVKPVAIVTPAAILGSVLTCGLWCLAAVAADRRIIPKPYQMGTGLTVGLVVAGVLLTALGFGAAAQFFWGLI